MELPTTNNIDWVVPEMRNPFRQKRFGEQVLLSILVLVRHQTTAHVEAPFVAIFARIYSLYHGNCHTCIARLKPVSGTFSSHSHLHLAIRKTKPRRIEWRCFCSFLRSRNRGMTTGIFTTRVCFWTKLVKFPWPYRGSYFVRKKKTPSFDSPWFGLSYGAFAIA